MKDNCTLNALRYEHKRDNLYKEDVREGLEQGQIVSGWHYSYFVPRKPSECPVVVPKRYTESIRDDYPITISIRKAFQLVKQKLSNKNGTTKKKILDMYPQDSYIYGCLLEYLRSEWQSGNRGEVILTKREFAMIAEKK